MAAATSGLGAAKCATIIEHFDIERTIDLVTASKDFEVQVLLAEVDGDVKTTWGHLCEWASLRVRVRAG